MLTVLGSTRLNNLFPPKPRLPYDAADVCCW